MATNKVAIFTYDLRSGPFRVIATALARGFQELGTNCDVVLLKGSEQDKIEFPDINIVALNAQRAAFSVPSLVRYIKEQKPQVIFSMPWYLNVAAILAKYFSGTDPKIIIGEHNIISKEAGIEFKNQLHVRYLPLLMRYTYPYADGLIGVCQDTLTDLVNEIKVPPSIPMRIIPNPINLNQVRQLSQETIDDPWWQNPQLPVILTVARLAKQKQLDVLIRAFAQVVNVLPAKLLILGDGPLRFELENLCQELQIEKYVSLPGYDSNPYKFMSACDIFVLASAWEGCPVALQEALACGAAVIVNDAPGGSKDIIEYGKHGIMVSNGDDQALAKAILQLITNINMKKNYQKQAFHQSEHFGYLNISKQYLDFAEFVVSQPKNNA